MKFKARPKTKTGMNGLEAEYASCLDMAVKRGEIEWYGFERFKLKLADNTFYTPDFAVQMPDGSMSMVETKGFWRDDARVKIKVAAEQYPMFQFEAIRKLPKKLGGGWDKESF